MSTAASQGGVFAPGRARTGGREGVLLRGAAVPWTLWTGLLAVTSATVGGAWDVAWHRSIGRDTFWTPAHLLIYACGVLAGLLCSYLIVQCTWGRNRALRDASVGVLGLRAPLGVFLAAWGGVAMLTSAPFDNWWHNAYGLDVKIVSPPHTLLILGIRAISIGVLFLILAAMNRAEKAGAANLPVLRTMFLYLGGLAVLGQMFFLQEYTWDVLLHRGSAYIAVAIGVPVVLAAIAAASRFRWAATTVTAIYMTMIVLEILILPLVPAQPKLGPVFNPVTHLVPAKFPVLLVVPAFALDLLWQRTRRWKMWQVAVVSGVLFTVLLAAVEWPFADFLMSKASQNRFFGTGYFDYNSRPDGVDRMRQFLMPEHGWTLQLALLRASVYAMFSTFLGLRFGRWMRSVER